jgi:hypothetical protein
VPDSDGSIVLTIGREAGVDGCADHLPLPPALPGGRARPHDPFAVARYDDGNQPRVPIGKSATASDFALPRPPALFSPSLPFSERTQGGGLWREMFPKVPV